MGDNLKTSVSSPRETCRYAGSHLPLGVTNEGREAIIISRVSSKFLAPLPGTPSDKIGELPTTFYLYFLVLLVYLLVFIFVSYIKNYKKNLPHLLLLWVPLKTPSCVPSLVTTTKILSALPLPNLPLQLSPMKLNLLC